MTPFNNLSNLIAQALEIANTSPHGDAWQVIDALVAWQVTAAHALAESEGFVSDLSGPDDEWPDYCWPTDRRVTVTRRKSASDYDADGWSIAIDGRQIAIDLDLPTALRGARQIAELRA